ncbi:NAD(P)/FAD-dependent oxidoreductase [Primorskyibacter marinus]|uniref:NAD(P)/FAD-dependent oxidoreductase n=1 Tax=Primorskyibacter marinus TaxID=1977320 RepID=UPI000E30B416|nr:NAD(P)/FAD-dependent oxidoreductase [Primorskyibacter marinus]
MEIDTLIIGAGAAGLMCATQTGGRTLLVDHAKKPGEKIRISGGGRCNFTNLHAGPANFLSGNPHFCKSALSRYTQWDFIALVEKHGIAWHEKTLGQLFCDDSAKQIVAMLTREAAAAGADLHLETSVEAIQRGPDRFTATLAPARGKKRRISARNIVLATGGKSIPAMGATGFAYDIARQFGLPVTETRAALVPFTFPEKRFADLSGTALPVRATTGSTSFDEAMLFTHRGLSGPAILQASSYWREGQPLAIDLSPGLSLYDHLRTRRQVQGGRNLTTELSAVLPAKLVQHLAGRLALTGNLADQNDARLAEICDTLHAWPLLPSGTEGYRTAEVTLGGIDTAALSSRTMEARDVPGLYVIGEAVDVTGWLGGYNFQWAWSSGWAAGQAIADTLTN